MVARTSDSSVSLRQGDVEGTHPAFLAGLHLVAHIDPAGRVVAHQDHRQAGGDALGHEGSDAGLEAFAELFREGLAVDDAGSHEFSLLLKKSGAIRQRIAPAERLAGREGETRLRAGR
jgi:hypothetical protein